MGSMAALSAQASSSWRPSPVPPGASKGTASGPGSANTYNYKAACSKLGTGHLRQNHCKSGCLVKTLLSQWGGNLPDAASFDTVLRVVTPTVKLSSLYFITVTLLL